MGKRRVGALRLGQLCVCVHVCCGYQSMCVNKSFHGWQSEVVSSFISYFQLGRKRGILSNGSWLKGNLFQFSLRNLPPFSSSWLNFVSSFGRQSGERSFPLISWSENGVSWLICTIYVSASLFSDTSVFGQCPKNFLVLSHPVKDSPVSWWGGFFRKRKWKVWRASFGSLG